LSSDKIDKGGGGSDSLNPLGSFSLGSTGQEASVELEHGKTLFVKLNGVGEVDDTGCRSISFEVRAYIHVIHDDQSVSPS
jgi:pyruvate carboxylase